jgi:hypothetical protein
MLEGVEIRMIRNDKEHTLFAVSPFLAILSAPTTEISRDHLSGGKRDKMEHGPTACIL